MYRYEHDPLLYRRVPPVEGLGPPEAYVGYADRAASTARRLPPGTHSTPTVARVIGTRCAGYATAPTPEQVCESLSCVAKARGCPDPANVWLTEATLPEIIDGWLEGAYRLDALVTALRDHTTRREDLDFVAWLNTFRVHPGARHN